MAPKCTVYCLRVRPCLYDPIFQSKVLVAKVIKYLLALCIEMRQFLDSQAGFILSELAVFL